MMPMYDYAKHLHRERLRTADQARLLAEVTPRRSRERNRHAGAGHWQVLWASSDITGKAVTIANPVTGERRVGRDPADWDAALGEAVRQLEFGV